MKFRRMLRAAAVGRLVFAVAATGGGAAAGPPLTTIQDVLYKADGTRFNGSAVVSWRSFEAVDQSAITMHNLTVKIVDGQLRVQLVPNAGAPAASYSVKYSSDGKIQFEESWVVPASSRPVRLRDVRVAVPAPVEAPTQITEAEVVGLAADLNARPTRGPGYAPGRAAVISMSGTLEAALGSPADCIRVDGSSGPCGSGGGAVDPGFMDNEAPAGAVDGSNVTFVLAATPAPAKSLALYRNGMLMKAGEDYSLAERTITFVAAAAPQPGDTLLASYRRQASAMPVTTPQVLCSGTGAGTNATSMAVLGGCEIPAGVLAAGDRVEMQFDYAHTGSQGGFTFEAAWGGTTMVSRTAPPAETLVSGRADAALTDSATQIGAQTWGGQMDLGTAVASAAGVGGNAVTIEFRGSVAAAGDTLGLPHYSVVRYPAPGL